MVSQPLPAMTFQDALSTPIQGRFFLMSLAFFGHGIICHFYSSVSLKAGLVTCRMAKWRRRAKQLPPSLGWMLEKTKCTNCMFLLFLLVPVLSFLQHISAPVMSRIKLFCSVSSSCPRLGILYHHSSKCTAFPTWRPLFMGLYSLKNRSHGRENHGISSHLLCWFQVRYLIRLHSAPFNLHALPDKVGYINSFPALPFHR